MRFKQFAAMLKARTMEFIRDRETLVWNIFFPVLLVVGFGFAFSGAGEKLFKVGVLGGVEVHSSWTFLKTPGVEFINYEKVPEAQDRALTKLRQHQIEMLVDPQTKQYWINSESGKSALVKQLLLGQAVPASGDPGFQEMAVTGKAVRYVDWAVPGVIGMNMMFSCLFGVGFVIVRYRKNGVLKRLKATPVTPLNFVLAQGVSRFMIVLGTMALVFFATNLIFGFTMNGSYFDLLLVSVMTILALISLGLVFATRFRSEELASGIINIVTFPMVLLSGVFFSLEGAPQFLQTAASALPLTHFNEASRKIMLDGAGLGTIAPDLLFLGVFTAGCMALAAWLFKWE